MPLSLTTKPIVFSDLSTGQGKFLTDGFNNYWPVAVLIDSTTGTVINTTDGLPVVVQPNPTVPLGYFQASVTASQTLAQIIGGTIPSGAKLCIIQPEYEDIRFRDDGVASTPSTGLRIFAGEKFIYTGNFSTVTIVSVTGDPVVIDVLFQG